MTSFEKGFNRTTARDHLLRRVLSHNRGLEVTAQPKPQDVGRTAVNPVVLMGQVTQAAPRAESLRARLAEQS